VADEPALSARRPGTGVVRGAASREKNCLLYTGRRQRVTALLSSPPRREILPEAIVLQNGAEFHGRAMTAWENGVCRWCSFSRASRCRMPAWKASTAGWAMNVECHWFTSLNLT